MLLLHQLACIALGYLIGSIPTARLITRFVVGKDVLVEGSGNAGAMNSYRVSGKRWVGVFVAAVDIAKGFCAVQVGMLVASSAHVQTFLLPAVAGFFCVFGHCYNLWQSGRGGRGLAPAAGVVLAINPVNLVVFCVMWLTGYVVIRRNIYVGTMAGAIGTPILMFNAPDTLLQAFMRVPCEKLSLHTVFIFLLCSVIVVRHAEPIRQLLNADEPEAK